MSTPLAETLRALIAREGPIPVARYMALCLTHPQHGYYVTRDPLGAAGDFTTAPEISQMFGELVGLWAADTWTRMGAPSPVALIELGPGRGTLMADMLRVAKVVPAFRAALDVHLVERSPVLQAQQRQTLAGTGVPIAWHDDLGDVPAGPFILIANEFLDALPVRQAVRTRDGWHERQVTVSAGGAFAFTAANAPLPPEDLPPHASEAVAEGAIVEWHDSAFIRTIAARVRRDAGAALFVDYGHTQSSLGETLQAVRRHGYADPLAEPGEADLTAHVDFAALAREATAAGARVHGPLTQGEFLRALGLSARAERLKASTSPDRARAIDAAVHRLAADAPESMGSLFKVLALTDAGVESLAGFAR